MNGKGIPLVLLLLFIILPVEAQVQNGLVKTRGRLGSDGKVISGHALPGAMVSIKGRNTVISNSEGMFSFPIPGHEFYIQEVRKEGYVLSDPDILSRAYSFSSNSVILVMESSEQKADELLANEKKIRRALSRQLEEKEAEIERLKEEAAISDEQYRQSLRRLYQDQQDNQSLVQQMSQYYSSIDYDQVDSFNVRVSSLIISGNLIAADSLVRNKGDIRSRIAGLELKQQEDDMMEVALNEEMKRLDRNRQLTRTQLLDIAQDCFNMSEIFRMQHQNDSAACYLVMRSRLDTTNVDWLLDAANYIEDYLDRYQEARNLFDSAMRESLHKNGENHPLTAVCYNDLGQLLSITGDYAEAEDYLHKSLEIKLRLGDSIGLASTYNNLGVLYSDTHRFQEALECHRKALEIRLTEFGEYANETAKCYNDIGFVYASMVDDDAAFGNYEKALSIYDRIGMDYVTVFELYNNIAALYRRAGEYDIAKEYYNRSLDGFMEYFGGNSEKVATIYNNIGLLYRNLGQESLSVEYLERALGIFEKIYSPGHINMANTENNIGISYIRTKDFDKAKEYLESSLEKKRALFEESDPEVLDVLGNLAYMYMSMGDAEESLGIYQKILNIYNNLEEVPAGDLKQCFWNIAACQKVLGNYTDAIESYTNALNVGQADPEVAPDDLVTLCWQVADLQEKTGNYALSKKYFREALSIEMSANDGDNTGVAVELYHRIGALNRKTGELSKALDSYRQAMRVCKVIYDSPSIEIAAAFNNIGNIYKDLGDKENAMLNYQSAKDMLFLLLPEDSAAIRAVDKNIEEVSDGRE